MGITPSQDIFVAPPNLLVSSSVENISGWEDAIVYDLRALLQNDEDNLNLVNEFAQNLKEGN